MKLSKFLILNLLVATLFACSNDDTEPDTITMADLEGSWIATSSIHTNNADASQVFDMVANGGEVRYTAFPDGRVRTWIQFGDFSDEWDAQGTLSGNILTTRPAESSRPVMTFTVKLGVNQITLTNANDTFDFTLAGATEVSTTSVTVFVPN